MAGRPELHGARDVVGALRVHQRLPQGRVVLRTVQAHVPVTPRRGAARGAGVEGQLVEAAQERHSQRRRARGRGLRAEAFAPQGHRRAYVHARDAQPWVEAHEPRGHEARRHGGLGLRRALSPRGDEVGGGAHGPSPASPREHEAGEAHVPEGLVQAQVVAASDGGALQTRRRHGEPGVELTRREGLAQPRPHRRDAGARVQVADAVEAGRTVPEGLAQVQPQRRPGHAAVYAPPQGPGIVRRLTKFVVPERVALRAGQGVEPRRERSVAPAGERVDPRRRALEHLPRELGRVGHGALAHPQGLSEGPPQAPRGVGFAAPEAVATATPCSPRLRNHCPRSSPCSASGPSWRVPLRRWVLSPSAVVTTTPSTATPSRPRAQAREARATRALGERAPSSGFSRATRASAATATSQRPAGARWARSHAERAPSRRAAAHWAGAVARQAATASREVGLPGRASRGAQAEL